MSSPSIARSQPQYVSMTTLPPPPPIFSGRDVLQAQALSTFHLFGKLPPELRLAIWHFELSRTQRLLQVRLRSKHAMIADSYFQGERGAGVDLVDFLAMQEVEYNVLLDSPNRLSKLFFTNRESRDAALSYYRVRIVCRASSDPPRHTKSPSIQILYLNPESDFLQIASDTDHGHVLLFLHRLKTVHDPRHIGLVNLILDRENLYGSGNFCGTDPTSMRPDVRTSFRETFAQLREVFVLASQGPGRHNGRNRPMSNNSPTFSDYRLNRALPVRPGTISFERMGRDPRPIKEHLTHVHLWNDPRRSVQWLEHWFHRHFGGEKIITARYQVLYAASGFSGGDGISLYSHQDAVRFLEREELLWLKDVLTGSLTREEKIAVRREQDPIVGTAFGFWLLPLEAFDQWPQGYTDTDRQYLDFSDHWPDLAVMSLD